MSRRNPDVLDNTGDGPLRVPGVTEEIPTNFEFPHGSPSFTDGANIPKTRRLWSQRPRLTVRELAMMSLMNRITDKEAWDEAVFRDDAVATWKAEESGNSLISDSVWAWCLTELKDKAAAVKQTGFVLALDSGSRVAKADGLVPSEVRAKLSEAVHRFAGEAGACDSDAPERILIDPLLYPLVFGRTGVLAKGGHVSLKDPFASISGARSVPPVYAAPSSNPLAQEASRLWSTALQRLPCEFSFTHGHNGAPQQQIKSYINNLHPLQHQQMYDCIETIIKLAVPAWDEVLVLNGRPRAPVRIRTYGGQRGPEYPEWATNLEYDGNNWEKKYPGITKAAEEYFAQPDFGPPTYPHSFGETEDWEIGENWADEWGLEGAIETKWKKLYRPLHPDAGSSFTYDDWKAGRTANAEVPKDGPNSIFRSEEDNDHEYYAVSLQEMFRGKGIQVIVSMTSVCLTPDNPEIPEQDWTLQGLLNDHIAATAIYYFDMDNISPAARISFRQATDLCLLSSAYEGDSGQQRDEYNLISGIFGIPGPEDKDIYDTEPDLQVLGAVHIRDGRLVNFPNTLEFRPEGLRLHDPTRRGSLRYLVLELVDPHYRICSTRNVPPQQHDWWAEAALAQVDWARRGVPLEVVEHIANGLDDWPMGREEAARIQSEFRAERERFRATVESNHSFHWRYH